MRRCKAVALLLGCLLSYGGKNLDPTVKLWEEFTSSLFRLTLKKDGSSSLLFDILTPTDFAQAAQLQMEMKRSFVTCLLISSLLVVALRIHPCNRSKRQPCTCNTPYPLPSSTPQKGISGCFWFCLFMKRRKYSKCSKSLYCPLYSLATALPRGFLWAMAPPP